VSAQLQLVHSIQRLTCTKCGAEANASCNCGVSYMPAAERVREYDKANPGQSTRAASADLGISQSEVQRARKSGEPFGSPETVTGRDGKSYPAKRADRAEEERNEAEALSPQAFNDAVLIYSDTAQEHAAKLIEFMGEGFTLTDEAINEVRLAAEAWSNLADILKVESEPEVSEDVKENILDTVSNQTAVASAYRRIFKVSSFDAPAKTEISKAINALISKWRLTLATLVKKPQ
jgi:hypothetical protein